MNKSQINATIVAHSIDPRGNELVSILATFPRIILAEVNTHRMLSKNTSSSRAIPFNKMVEAIQENPFIPIAWQKDHKGMQGGEYLTYAEANKEDWLKARDYAVEYAQNLNNGGEGVTKQLCNRLLEPFMWTTMLITGSKEGWNNFFELRCPQYTTPVAGEGYYAKSWKELESWHSNPINEEILENANTLFKLQHNKGQAEIHIMDLAEKIYDAMNESTPKQLKAGEWHIPFIDRFDSYSSLNTDVSAIDLREDFDMNDIKISTAMAARVSYTTIEDEKELNYEKLIKLHDKLIEDRHDSPLEHCAQVMTDKEYYSFIRGEYPTYFDGTCGSIFNMEIYPKQNKEINEDIYGWCKNFKGFMQYRYFVENGYDE